MNRELHTKLRISQDGADDTSQAIKRVADNLEGVASAAKKGIGKIDAFEVATADLGKLQGALDEARKRLTYFRDQAKGAGDAGAKAFAGDIKATEREIDRLSSSIDKHNLKLRGMAADLAKAGVDTKNLAGEKLRLADAMKRAETGIIQLKGKLLEEQAAAGSAAGKTKEAGDSAEKAGNQAGKGSASFADLARSMAGLTASAAAITAVSKQAIEFESAMADVAKVTDASDEQIAALASRIKELSTELPISADGLAQMAAAGGQLGIPIQNLEQFIAVSARMATAFTLSAEQAGDAVAKLMNVFGLSLDQVEQLGDAVNVLGNTTAAREADIVEFLVRVGGSAKQFGLAAEQASALGTALISMGAAPQVAANSINGLLSKLQTAKVAGDEFQGALGRIGLSADKLADDIRANPQAALLEFLKTLERLDGQSRAEVLTKLFGLEYQDDISKLVGSLGLYEQALGSVADKARVSGAMSEEFRKRMETTGAQIDILKNSIEVAAINLGTVFLPALNATLKPLADVAQGVAAFAEEHPKVAAMAIALGTAAASVGALKLAFDGLGSLASAGAAEMARFKKSVTETEAEIGKLGLAMHGLSAGLVGWEIGTWASENFSAVRKAGVLMVEGLLKGFEELQYKWEMFQALFTGDTIEQATARHIARFKELDDWAKQAYLDAEEGPKKVAEATDKAAASQADLAKAGRAAGEQLAAAQGQAIAATEATSEAAKQLADDLKRLKIDPEEFKSGMTSAEKALVDSFDRMVAMAEASSDMLLVGFGEALQEVGVKGVEAFGFSIQDAFQKGRVSAEQLDAAMQMVEVRRKELTSGAKELEEAYKTLGIQSQESLSATANKAKEAYEAIRASGASVEVLNTAWAKYAETAIAANGGVADSTIQAGAASRGLAVAVDETGKATVKSAAEAEKAQRAHKGAIEETGEAAKEAAEKISEADRKARDAGFASAEAMALAEDKINRWRAAVVTTWETMGEKLGLAADQVETFRDILSELTQGMTFVGTSGIQWFNQLQQHAADLTRHYDALTRSLDRMNSSARRGLDDLELRLVEVNGTEEEIAKSRREREREGIEVELKKAQIEARRSALKGDDEAARKYREEAKLLREQLDLLDKIYAAEDKRAREEEAKQRQQEQAAPSPAPPPTPAPVTTSPAPAPVAPAYPPGSNRAVIEVHIHGYTDMDRLARELQPHLDRLLRLRA